MATVVQNPGYPTLVTPVIVGEEGNGKNFFFDMFAAIFGRHLHVSTTNLSDFERFNRSLEGKALITVNEMIPLESGQWAHLRGFITDATIRIEQKGLEVRTVPNVANVLCISNVVDKDLFPDIGTNARRICLLTCRNVTKPPLRWFRFFEWAGCGMNCSTYKDCPGTRALADFLYSRRVTSQVKIIPEDEDGVTAGITALNPIHQ